MKPKLLLIVLPAAGLNIWDLPRPQSQGAIKRRSVPKGTLLHAYAIINFQGVPYAWLVSQDPYKPEWARVAEADGTGRNLEIVEELKDESSTLAAAVKELAEAIRYLANQR